MSARTTPPCDRRRAHRAWSRNAMLWLAAAAGLRGQDASAAPANAQPKAQPSAAPNTPSNDAANAAPSAEATLQLARSLMQALAPERDDPTARARDLLAAALAAPRSPAAAVLAEEAKNRLQGVDAAALTTWLAEQRGSAPQHGLLQNELREIDLRLRRLQGQSLPENPWPEVARAVAVVGPFGDAGRYCLDVTFPPDAGFPASGVRMRGRFGDVAPRALVRDGDRSDLWLQPPGLRRPGCYFVLWRVAAAAATAGFLEVGYAGAFLARVDGVEVGRADPFLQPGASVRRLPIRMQPGEHRIVVKTGDATEAGLQLRLLDAAGAPLPQVVEVAPDAPAPAQAAAPDGTEAADPRDTAVFRSGLQVFRQQAEAAAGDDRALLAVAAAWTAQRSGEVDDALGWMLKLDAAPPALPEACLVLADLWLRATAAPDEQRTARARALEETAQATLAPHHHRALLARVRQLEDQDQREAALRLLRAEIAAGRAGPATFAQAFGIVRRLRFQAEEEDLLERWCTASPREARPLMLLAERRQQQGDIAAAWTLAERAVQAQPTDDSAQRRTFDLALDLGRFDAAQAAIDRNWRAGGNAATTLRRLRAEAELALRQGDTARLQRIGEALLARDDADAVLLAQLADQWLRVHDDARALQAIDQSLRRDPDQPALLQLQARLQARPVPGSDFAPFRRDGDAAIAAFRPGDAERGASTSLLIDQRIVEVLPDGQALVEVHELHRINDQQGVDALRTPSDPASADELLLLRTVDTSGRTYVPTRVEGAFAMPRLEPGAFVEWRYRRWTRAPDADPLRLDDFLFASHQEPLYCTEYVLIRSQDGRGALRTRNLAAAPVVTTLADGRIATAFCLTGVARLPEESSPPPTEDRIPMAGFGEDASPWPGLRQRRAAMWLRTRPTPPLAEFAAQLVAGAADDQERSQRVHAFCQREIADGDTGDATEVLLRKKGNRFVLAVALLRAAGVAVEPAACARFRPELAEDGEPLFAADDPAPVACARIAPAAMPPQWLFADTPRHWPLGAVPAHRSGGLVYVLGAARAEQLRLPHSASAANQLDVEGTCAVQADGTVVRARVRISDLTGYTIAEQLRRRTADVQRMAARQLGQQFFANWRVRKAATAGLDPGGEPLAIDLEVADAPAQVADDGRWLLALPMPPSDLRAAFGDRDERTMPLRLRADLAMNHRIEIDPGPGRVAAALPLPLLLTLGPLDYQLTFTPSGRNIVVERRVRLRPGTVERALYAEWIRLLASIDRKEQERLVLVPSGG